MQVGQVLRDPKSWLNCTVSETAFPFKPVKKVSFENWLFPCVYTKYCSTDTVICRSSLRAGKETVPWLCHYLPNEWQCVHSEGMGHILSAEGGYWGGGSNVCRGSQYTFAPLVFQSVISLSWCILAVQLPIARGKKPRDCRMWCDLQVVLNNNHHS